MAAPQAAAAGGRWQLLHVAGDAQMPAALAEPYCCMLECHLLGQPATCGPRAAALEPCAAPGHPVTCLPSTATCEQVVVVLSGSMEPGFYRGDILFLHQPAEPPQTGDISAWPGMGGAGLPGAHSNRRVGRQRGGCSGLLREQGQPACAHARLPTRQPPAPTPARRSRVQHQRARHPHCSPRHQGASARRQRQPRRYPD